MTKSKDKNRLLDDFSHIDWVDNFTRVAKSLLAVFLEPANGICYNTLPWAHCSAIGTVLCLTMNMGIDYWLLSKMEWEFIYPTHQGLFVFYYLTLALSPFWGWGVLQVGLKRRLLKKLTLVFNATGLKNNLGKPPNFIFDRPLDASTRILRLSRSQLPKSKFEQAKDSLEASLQVHIDEIKESIADGTVDIIYAHEPMPSLVKFTHKPMPKHQFIVGATRSGEITASFEKVPHLLIAGQTGGGKSSWLRQFIVSLYKNNSDYSFTLVDMKGGLEFQMFSNLERARIASETELAHFYLTGYENELKSRYQALNKLGCKDLEAFYRLPIEKRQGVGDLNRHIIVIDEIAELFLSGSTMPAAKAKEIRSACSKIARQGRAVGVHLIACTQRPDARALDTQIKGQLPGKLCFQMTDTASSTVVLNNTRARDLPAIPGRAIWQNGMKQIEVQVPYLSVEDAEKALGLKTAPKKSESSTKQNLANPRKKPPVKKTPTPASKVTL